MLDRSSIVLRKKQFKLFTVQTVKELTVFNLRRKRLQPILSSYVSQFLLQFKEFELYWGAIFFFKICSHIFMIFKLKLEQWFWSRRNRKWSEKASGFAAWNFFAPNLKESEKTVFEQKFAFSLVVFCSHAAISLWF